MTDDLRQFPLSGHVTFWRQLHDFLSTRLSVVALVCLDGFNRAPRKSKNRPRNITWFNPPYSQNVETKVGKCFLQLVDKHFPKSNPLHKIFNRNTLKLSYSCMSNVKTIISSHNKAQIKKHRINQKKSIISVIAETRIPAHLREIVISGTLSIKQRSWPHRQKRHTSDYVTQHSRNATETIHVLSGTNGTKMQPSSASTYGV